MVRPLRLDVPQEFFHVLARGNSRLPIFGDDRDRKAFLRLLDEVVERFDVRCHAYCLMGNHYHLLLQPMAGGLPRAIRQLNGVYAQRFNRRHGRTGHLFEGRYKCLLVDKQTYLLELARYIALNPVRAGLVATADAWEWSSYRATAGLATPLRFLTVDFIRHVSGGREGALGAQDFASLVASASDEAFDLGDLLDDAVAGSRPFKEKVARERKLEGVSGEVPIAHRLLDRPPLSAILQTWRSKSDRDARIRTAVLTHGYTQAAVADLLHLGRNTVSRIVRTVPARSVFSGEMVQRET